MAITKIHPIKSTVNLAIDYITKKEKTDENILVSSYKCNSSTAYKQFDETRKSNNTKGTVYARHLIQSFLPGEVTPEKAHEIGMELCKKVLKDEYEFILATHIDRGHIHNHIIFNNVNFETGKCYKSNKRTYHIIRTKSDELCEKYKLSVIDKYYEAYKRKYKTAGKSWYEYEQSKQGKSWKSKLQFDIDRMINKSNSWDEFLKNMKELDYEIKNGKYVAFKHKDKKRFTRAKTIGEDYTEDKIKERINESVKNRNNPNKKRVNNVINLSTSKKVKTSKRYEFWATKHNLKAMAETIIELRNLGINSQAQLEELIEKTVADRQNIVDSIKNLEKQMNELSNDMEDVHTINMYRETYKYHKKNPKDKEFESEYKSELTIYKKSAEDILKKYGKLPDTKNILEQLDKLQAEKEKLMDKYNINKDNFSKYIQYKNNYDNYYGKDQDRDKEKKVER